VIFVSSVIDIETASKFELIGIPSQGNELFIMMQTPPLALRQFLQFFMRIGSYS